MLRAPMKKYVSLISNKLKTHSKSFSESGTSIYLMINKDIWTMISLHHISHKWSLVAEIQL